MFVFRRNSFTIDTCIGRWASVIIKTRKSYTSFIKISIFIANHSKNILNFYPKFQIGPKLKEILVTYIECNHPEELDVEKIMNISEVNELFKEVRK